MTTAKIQQIQVTKETAKQQADAAVMTDEHAVHAVVTPWKAPAVIAAGVLGAGAAALAGVALLPIVAVGAAVATAEHYRVGGGLVNKLTAKLGLFKTKAPAPAPNPTSPIKPAAPPVGPGVPPPGAK